MTSQPSHPAISTRNAWVEFPIFDAKSRSLKKAFLGKAGGAIGRTMGQPDAACVNQTLERGQTGQTVAWQNPDNGTTYNVTPIKTYQREGRPCRDYTTTAVIDGQNQTLRGTACRQSDGTWKTIDSSGDGQ